MIRLPDIDAFAGRTRDFGLDEGWSAIRGRGDPSGLRLPHGSMLGRWWNFSPVVPSGRIWGELIEVTSAKKILPLFLVLWISLTGCVGVAEGIQAPGDEEPGEMGLRDEDAVAELVEDFGKQIRNVSRHDPANIREHYEGLVSPELLAAWLDDPSDIPCRLTSSPWPDRIEIMGIEWVTEGTCEVDGEIIEITSTERETANRRAITLVVTRVGDHWLIDAVTLGSYDQG